MAAEQAAAAGMAAAAVRRAYREGEASKILRDAIFGVWLEFRRSDVVLRGLGFRFGEECVLCLNGHEVASIGVGWTLKFAIS